MIADLKDLKRISHFDYVPMPGSVSSLEKEKATGADIRIVFFALDLLEMARSNPLKKVIFLGIGFETTTGSSVFDLFSREA